MSSASTPSVLDILNEEVGVTCDDYENDPLAAFTLEDVIEGHTFDLNDYKKYDDEKPPRRAGTGKAVRINECRNLCIIDIDIKKSLDDDVKESIRSELIGKLSDRDVIVKTGSGGLHIYSLLNGFKMSSNAIIKAYECDKFDVDVFGSIDDKHRHVVLPGSKIRFKQGEGNVYGMYTFIRGGMKSLILRSADDVINDLGITITDKSERKTSAQTSKLTKNVSKSYDEDVESFLNDDVSDALCTFSDEVINAIIDGFEGVTIHNDAGDRSIKDEITLFTLFQALNALPKKWVDIAYDTIKSTAELTENASNNFDAARYRYRNRKTSAGYLLTLLKYHNCEYYEESVRPLLKSLYEVQPIDLKDSFTIDDIMRKANDGMYKGKHWEAFVDVSRVIRLVSSGKFYVEKVYDIISKTHTLKFTKFGEMNSFLGSIIIDRVKGKKITLHQCIEDNIGKITSKGVMFALPNQSLTGPFTADDIVSMFHGYKYNIVKKEDVKEDIIHEFLSFIREVIADNNDEVYLYIIQWIAYILQNPGKKTETALVLQGIQGAGKNTFTNVLSELLSGYSEANITDIHELTGSFNSAVEGRMLLVLNELRNAGDDRMANFDSLKSLITDRTVRINEKNQPRRTAENVANFILCTNNSHPVKLEISDRRYCVLQVNGIHAGDHDYFKRIHSSFTAEFYDHLLSYFVHYDIADFNVRRIPGTDAKEELTIGFMSTIDKWIVKHFEELKEGMIDTEAIRDKPNELTAQTFRCQLLNKCRKDRKRIDGCRHMIYTLKPEYIKHFEPYVDVEEEDEE